MPTASVLALYTYRPDFDSPWAGRSHVTPILLPRLTRSQVREMVRGAARGRVRRGAGGLSPDSRV